MVRPDRLASGTAGVFPSPPEYVPYRQVGDRPNVIVDGMPLQSTVLMLSHWPGNDTPEPLRRDTSTAIVFAYLDTPQLHQSLPVVSNNHFDEDGLFSMFTLCAPDIAMSHRELLIDASVAGDFGVFESRQAARLCFVIESCADPACSPLDAAIFRRCERQMIAGLYRAMLERLPEILGDLSAHRQLWTKQDSHLDESLRQLEAGTVRIEEDPSVDMAVVRISAGLPDRIATRYLRAERAPVHPFAIHQHTHCGRLLRVQGRQYELQFRYESWVHLASRRPALRVDLAPLAQQLNRIETACGTWIAEPVGEVVPRLFLDGSDASSIDADRFVDICRDYLANAPIAWDPYSWKPA